MGSTQNRFTATIAMMLVALAVSTTAMAQTEQQKVVDLADKTLNDFLHDPQMTWLRSHVGQAKGIIVASNVVKAGFIVGGSGGRAVLIAKNASGKWGGPAFYDLGTASVGFLAGVSVSQVVMLVMTDKGMRSLLATSVKLGPEVGIAAGPIGAAAQQDLITDIVTFSRSKGLYGGLDLTGSALTVSDSWNSAYYGKPVQPSDILIEGKVRNHRADKLLRSAAAGGRKGA